MCSSTTNPPNKMNSKAEGAPNEREQLEPATALRTSTIPVIDETLGLTASDTGLNIVVKLDRDGRDYNEAQDASLTLDEISYIDDLSSKEQNKK